MITLTGRLRKLVNPKARGKGRLPAAENRSVILGGRGVGTREASEDTGGSGLRPPFDEQSGVRQYYAESDWTSSDGFFVIVRANIKYAEFRDQDNTSIPVNYVDEP